MSDSRIYYLLTAIVIPLALYFDPTPSQIWIGVLMFKVIGPSVKRPHASFLRLFFLGFILIFLGPAVFGLFIGKTPTGLLSSIAQYAVFSIAVLCIPLDR